MSVWWICLSNQKIKCTKRKICSLFCYIFSVWTLFVYNWGTTNLTSLFFFTGQQRNCRMTQLKKKQLHPKFDLQPLRKQFSLCAISVYTLFNIQLTLNKWQPILQLLHSANTETGIEARIHTYIQFRITYCNMNFFHFKRKVTHKGMTFKLHIEMPL